MDSELREYFIFKGWETLPLTVMSDAEKDQVRNSLVFRYWKLGNTVETLKENTTEEEFKLIEDVINNSPAMKRANRMAKENSLKNFMEDRDDQH